MNPFVPLWEATRPVVHLRHRWPALLGWLLVLGTAGIATADDPVAMRMETFLVAPSHMPPAIVTIKNLEKTAYEGTIRIKLPDGWTHVPQQQTVSLKPGETKRVRFTIKRGRTTRVNSYPVEISATSAGNTLTHRQDVVCTSAPYFKPEIDGQTDDWNDAIPVTFTTSGKKTVISTYWNRRQFSILVAVEEDSLAPYGGSLAPTDAFDAVQLALSPQETTTGTTPDEEATRYEFLFVSTGEGTGGKCFQLAQPEMKLGEGQSDREFASLEFDKAKIAVRREGSVTYYECGIPFRSLSGIKASEGREFFLSVLVHDPGGTGIRDWGQAAGRWAGERNRLAWSRFPGAEWADEAPFDNKTPWGMCSSKY